MQYTALLFGSVLRFFIGEQKSLANGNIINAEMLVITVPMMICSSLLWIFSDKLTGAIVGKVEEEIQTKAHDYKMLQYIAFSFVGILIFSGAIPPLISHIYQTVVMFKQGFITKDSMNYISYISGIMQNALCLVVGLCLVLGSKGIVRAIHKFRNAGIIEADEKQDL